MKICLRVANFVNDFKRGVTTFETKHEFNSAAKLKLCFVQASWEASPAFSQAKR